MGDVHINQIGNVWYEIILTCQEWKLFKKALLNLPSVYVRTAKNTRLIFWLTQYPQNDQTDQTIVSSFSEALVCLSWVNGVLCPSCKECFYCLCWKTWQKFI